MLVNGNEPPPPPAFAGLMLTAALAETVELLATTDPEPDALLAHVSVVETKPPPEVAALVGEREQPETGSRTNDTVRPSTPVPDEFKNWNT